MLGNIILGRRRHAGGRLSEAQTSLPSQGRNLIYPFTAFPDWGWVFVKKKKKKRRRPRIGGLTNSFKTEVRAFRRGKKKTKLLEKEEPCGSRKKNFAQ